MNTGEVHPPRAGLANRIDEVTKKDLAADLWTNTDVIGRPRSEAEEQTVTSTVISSGESEAPEQQLIDKLIELITQEFDHLRNSIERYKWIQSDIEAHIRNMLHIVHAKHSRENQVERMVGEVAKDIAVKTIGEDMQGPISQRGYSEQFFVEIDQLAEAYRLRENEIISALNESKSNELIGERDKFIDELVRKPLEHVRSVMYHTHSELIQLLQEQRRIIRDNLDGFQQLQYFQTEEVWQNPAYRLLQEYCDKAIQLIDTQLENLRSQFESDEKQIDGLAKESLLVIQEI